MKITTCPVCRTPVELDGTYATHPDRLQVDTNCPASDLSERGGQAFVAVTAMVDAVRTWGEGRSGHDKMTGLYVSGYGFRMVERFGPVVYLVDESMWIEPAGAVAMPVTADPLLPALAWQIRQTTILAKG